MWYGIPNLLQLSEVALRWLYFVSAVTKHLINVSIQFRLHLIFSRNVSIYEYYNTVIDVPAV
jgi:hypothetical protein